MNIHPPIQTDFYKQPHYKMYPKNTTKLYSNLTPRKSRIEGIDHVVVFGFQYLIFEYFTHQWNKNFFNKPKEKVLAEYKRLIDNTLGKDVVDLEHISKLHDLGYLPLEIKALPEGSLCPIRVPVMTITNTVDHAYWLVNFLETIISCVVWGPMTAATIAFKYRQVLEDYARVTCDDNSHVQWQAHDFSMRGLIGSEAPCLIGGGHLLSFTGTDTIPAIQFLEDYYFADTSKELVGASVPATEHSVMCMGTETDEIGTFKRLIDMFPNGILSVVSDTWNIWTVLTVYLPGLKDQILARNGKLVIRHDSGDPVLGICGYGNKFPTLEEAYDENGVFEDIDGKLYDVEYKEDDHGYAHYVIGKEITEEERKGMVELLWDTFGGTVNGKGYKELDPHIGAIYGDSITIGRAMEICERLMAKGFASSNIVLGVGSYTYQYNTRDTFGFAVKATYGELKDSEGNVECREIYKDPITDDGTKKSAKGLIAVFHDGNDFFMQDQCTWEVEKSGELRTIFYNGVPQNVEHLQIIRDRLMKNIKE